MQRYFSVAVAASAVYKDAATAPLVANVYVCRHLKNEVSIHAEVHDPDCFPGSPPTFLPLSSRTPYKTRQSEEQLTSALDSAAQHLVSEYGVSRSDAVAPAPSCLHRAVSAGEEALVRTSSFWGQLYANLDPSALDALPADEVSAMKQCAAELANERQLRFADKLLLMAYPECIRLQDGIFEWAELVARAPQLASQGLDDERRRWLRAAVVRASTCTNAPVAFELSDFLADGSLRVLTCLKQPMGAPA